MASLELQPTLEDVFHADTTSVEDYLQQIQEMTILTAIQVLHVGVCSETVQLSSQSAAGRGTESRMSKCLDCFRSKGVECGMIVSQGSRGR